jgi:uncharacterized protein YecE (DUF72 family)
MATAGRALVGVSGWSYRSWRGQFYPPGLRQADELAFVGERLGTVELNASFYSLRRPENYLAWRDQMPDGGVVSVKAGRYITHVRRLRDARQAVANFLASGVLALGPRLGPILWQLPPNMTFDPDVLDSFLSLLPHRPDDVVALASEHDERLAERAHLSCTGIEQVRHALELRHPSFSDARVARIAERHGVALVATDAPALWPRVWQPSSDLIYCRLHGPTQLYRGSYDEDHLGVWAERLAAGAASGHDVLAYFNNDADGCAPYDALALAALIAGHGASTWPNAPTARVTTSGATAATARRSGA